MSTLKNYRAIGVVDENGNTITVMMVHQSVDDGAIERIMRRYHYEVVRRMIQQKIDVAKWMEDGNRCGKSIAEVEKKMNEGIHVVHRINLLKKLVRMTPETNGIVIEYHQVISGPVYDCKDFKKRNTGVMVREYEKMKRNGDMKYRIIETAEEKEWYEQFGHTYMESIRRELVYFVDVDGRDERLKKVNLYSDIEEMVKGE